MGLLLRRRPLQPGSGFLILKNMGDTRTNSVRAFINESGSFTNITQPISSLSLNEGLLQ